MKRSVVHALILSDLQRHRSQILLSIAGGVVALALLQIGGELATIIGSTWFFISLIVFGSMLPMSNVVNERKKQILPFLMSLPMSVSQYTTAKLVSTLGIFLLSWVTLVIAAVSFIAAREAIPNGLIPTTIVLATFTLIGFCMIAGVALVSESEGWAVATTVASNSCYGLAWYLMIRNAALRANMGGATVVWSPEILSILGAQIAAIAVILGITFYLQSRKRDFV